MINNKLVTVVFTAFTAALFTPFAVAGDATQGAQKATACVQCHGNGGNNPIADYPKIGGQHEKYLLYALRAYKSGARNNAIMSAQLANLSDSDLADLAAYFAAQDGDLRDY